MNTLWILFISAVNPQKKSTPLKSALLLSLFALQKDVKVLQKNKIYEKLNIFCNYPLSYESLTASNPVISDSRVGSELCFHSLQGSPSSFVSP